MLSEDEFKEDSLESSTSTSSNRSKRTIPIPKRNMRFGLGFLFTWGTGILLGLVIGTVLSLVAVFAGALSLPLAISIGTAVVFGFGAMALLPMLGIINSKHFTDADKLGIRYTRWQKYFLIAAVLFAMTGLLALSILPPLFLSGVLSVSVLGLVPFGGIGAIAIATGIFAAVAFAAALVTLFLSWSRVQRFFTFQMGRLSQEYQIPFDWAHRKGDYVIFLLGLAVVAALFPLLIMTGVLPLSIGSLAPFLTAIFLSIAAMVVYSAVFYALAWITFDRNMALGFIGGVIALLGPLSAGVLLPAMLVTGAPLMMPFAFLGVGAVGIAMTTLFLGGAILLPGLALLVFTERGAKFVNNLVAHNKRGLTFGALLGGGIVLALLLSGALTLPTMSASVLVVATAGFVGIVITVGLQTLFRHFVMQRWLGERLRTLVKAVAPTKPEELVKEYHNGVRESSGKVLSCIAKESGLTDLRYGKTGVALVVMETLGGCCMREMFAKKAGAQSDQEVAANEETGLVISGSD